MGFLKQIGFLVLIGAISLAGYYGWEHYTKEKTETSERSARKKQRVVDVETEAARFRDLDILVEAVGSTLAMRSVEITPLASGRVTKIDFAAGQTVKAGDVLMRLDDEIQRADLKEAQSRLKEANLTLKRSETLKKQNAVSVATVDGLQAQVAIAQAEVDRASKHLKDRIIRAPFDGVVGYTSVELGARVDVGKVVTVLDDLSAVQIEFSLPESLFGKIDLGRPVIADAAPYPGRVFNGAIDTINSRIDTVSRSFKARAVIANDDRALPSGMFVHLSIVLNSETALAVPEEAIIVDGSRAYLFAVVMRDGQHRVERREITLGRRSFGFVEVTAGVNDGEQVVTRGIQKVRNNSLVRLKGGVEKRKPKPKSEQPNS